MLYGIADHPDGWLKVIGTGIRLGQLTFEAQQALEEADVVFAVVAGAPALEMVRSYNARTIDLTDLYGMGKERRQTYREMADTVIDAVRKNQRVCFAIYGHPRIFALPGMLAIEGARRDGYQAEFIPGISALDSMWCDLEVDPAEHGCQLYSATSFVRENRIFDPRAILTLWQVSIIGESRLMAKGNSDDHQTLCDRLEVAYGADHPVIMYEAATTPFWGPIIEAISIADLRSAKVRPCVTLFIPPVDFPDLGAKHWHLEPAMVQTSLTS